MTVYLACMRTSRGEAEPCKEMARAYLACRMAKYAPPRDADAGAIYIVTKRGPRFVLLSVGAGAGI